MKNTKAIQFKLPYRAAAQDVKDKKQQVEIGKERIRGLLDSLRALGCLVRMEETSTGSAAVIAIAYPSTADARKATKRGGRRMKIEIPAGSPLKGKTVGDARDWMEDHTAKECAAALGCSVSQYFRRKKYFDRMPDDAPIEGIWSTK